LVQILALVPVMGQTDGAVNARLEDNGRTVNLTAQGMTVFRGGFSAAVMMEGDTHEISSDSGTVVGAQSDSLEEIPYGTASVSFSTVRFEKEHLDLLFRLDKMRGRSCVLLRAGIRNYGNRPVNLVRVSPLAMDETIPAGLATTHSPRLLQVSGNPAEWLITGFFRNTPVLASLSSIRTPLDMNECGGCYRRDGVGFLFGPVGVPVSYVSAHLAAFAGDKAELTLTSDMSCVRVGPGQTRWGQQMALFMEPPATALVRWSEWVAKTHGARTAKGALAGWSSWYSLREQVTGKDVLSVADQVLKSGGRLRPDVIQIDNGYEVEGKLETNAKFPEGLPFYARRIAATGARPGLKLAFSQGSNPADVVEKVGRAVQMGFTYLKLELGGFKELRGDEQTTFESRREVYEAIRKAAGENTYLLDLKTYPERASLGFIDASRTGGETYRQGLRPVIEEVLRSYHLNNRWFAVDDNSYFMATELKDVSPLAGGWPLARTWISMVGLSCGAAITSDPWNEPRFKPYWRNTEILTPAAKEQTEVVDLGISTEWPRLVGHVSREWGDWTVALLWNPADKEQVVTLDFARIGLDPKRRYAIWSFWDNRYLGVAEGSYTTPFLAASASQHLCFTELPRDSDTPVLIGSGLHIYCGAAELKRVTSLRSAMRIELTDAGARDGDLFIYSRFRPVVKDAAGCTVEGINAAGENVWRLALKNRRHGELQRVELDIPQPITRQGWFWGLLSMLAASLLFGGWRYRIAMRLQRERALEVERLRIASDIHDEVGASLTKIGRLATALSDPRIAETTREVVQAMDEIVWAVNPRNDTLDNMANYLVHYAEEFVHPTGLYCDLDVPLTLPERPLSAEIRHNVFMVVKEALNNAVKHGAPARIRLGLTFEVELLTVTVQDDGRGFTIEAIAKGTDGLANMRQRLTAIGGQLHLRSEPGRGTSVTLQVRLTGKPMA
jgi:signal transduction histidine kinase